MISSTDNLFLKRFADCFKNGAKKGIKSTIWLLTLMLPISLVVKLLAWSGILRYSTKWLHPFFKMLGLPGESALAFLTAGFVNLYSGIAVMGSIVLNNRQVTILAIMMLISHNLPVEIQVQRKAGSSGIRMVLLRLGMSVLAAGALNYLLPADISFQNTRAVISTAYTQLSDVLRSWFFDSLRLIGKVSAIVICLMIFQRILVEFKLLRPLSSFVLPVLRIMGLPKKTAFLWIVANTLGLAYGATVILDEIKSGALTREEVEILNRSIAVCHSLPEDTPLFVAVGAWPLWIIVPRLVLAAGVVWLYRAYKKPFKKSISENTGCLH